ncbi:MAG: shikimate kinase [Clostridiales bacterium]|nr:shikimate kinase [Clostridiales bacterium]MCD7828157.1 shikimate kinase [Clostridiales bacterium]
MNFGKRNIILIGMPGAGKSTLGVLLAKALGMSFTDTDLLIQQREQRLLQDIINGEGIDNFLKIEERVLLSLDTDGIENTIIATGGSAVYSERAMKAFKNKSLIVYLHVDYSEIEKRITDIKTRGIVLKSGNSLSDTYKERLPLYEKYADITIDCTNKSIEESIEQIIAQLSKR